MGFSPLQQQNWFCKKEVKIPPLEAFACPWAQLLIQATRSQSHLWLSVAPTQVTRGRRGLEPGKERTGLDVGLNGWEPGLARLFPAWAAVPAWRGPGRAGRAAGRLGLPVPPSGYKRKSYSPYPWDVSNTVKCPHFNPQPAFCFPPHTPFNP